MGTDGNIWEVMGTERVVIGTDEMVMANDGVVMGTEGNSWVKTTQIDLQHSQNDPM